jgi:methylated-DNA-[protein]-cysteine S-methyltransferase
MPTSYIETPLGCAKIVGDEKGISSLTIVDTQKNRSEIIASELEDCVEQVEAYFSNQLTQFNLTLNPQGTAFQKMVWRELQFVPYGTTMSYLELSKKIGNVKAIRAIANASAKNPIWIIVPCHRIIGSNGGLIGYAGGLHRKQWLLNHESKYKQESLF